MSGPVNLALIGTGRIAKTLLVLFLGEFRVADQSRNV